jgi:lysine 6-dehydrogenase
MTYHYLIIGSGRQGTAAAYDLARFGAAASIKMADVRAETAQAAAERVNRLVGRPVASSLVLDAADPVALRQALQNVDVALSAVTYYFNLGITQACIESGVSLCDMGGNTDVVLAQIELNDQARAAGVSVVPDCGMGPGLINTMGVYVMDMFDTPREVYLYDGGLPQNPPLPWNYQLTFHINGLTNEYAGQATFIRNGEITLVDTFSELEYLDIPPLGRVEAFVISGSMSTTPWTHLGRLERYENKVLRYPGHFEVFRGYRQLGLFSEEPVLVEGQWVKPRALYHALLEPQITAPLIKDICMMRAVCVGEKEGRTARVTVDVWDRYDEETGFTGMERLTGWHCAIMMALQATGKIVPGAHPMETAVPADVVMQALRQRGIDHSIAWE